MEWYHVVAMIFGNAAWSIPLFLWLRTEANSDRRDIINIILEMKEEFRIETKDFHGRLCRLEERYLDIKEYK